MPTAGGPTVRRLSQPDADIKPKALGLPRGRTVISVFGSTQDVETDLAAKLLPVLRSVVVTAARHGAVFVTEGTDRGVVHLLGLALRACEHRRPVVVGVAPSSKVHDLTETSTNGQVALEPHHSVAVIVPGSEWTDATPVLFRTVDAVRHGKPVIALVVGGENEEEVVDHLGGDNPLLVLAGTGGLADRIATGDLTGDLAILVRSGKVSVVHVDEGPAKTVTALERLLGKEKPVKPPRVWPEVRYRAPQARPLVDPGFVVAYPALADAIHDANQVVAPAFHELDAQADVEQNRYRLMAVLAIAGGLTTTVFGALQTWLKDTPWPGVLVVAGGAFAAVITIVARKRESLDKYLTARYRAERLRALYFAHLAAPASGSEQERQDRVADLEAAVSDRKHEVVRT
ncbi:HU-CCDC81 and SPOR domain-containing protein [Lentzea xinjiangensis]|nr:HU-CCDC81 and SPOR domain-containing protein [Lentzea xinjiangensis]